MHELDVQINKFNVGGIEMKLHDQTAPVFQRRWTDHGEVLNSTKKRHR